MNPPGKEIATPFHLRFWGVRGSIPVPGARYAGVGGNTSCVQVLSTGIGSPGSGEVVIFDAGSGIRQLGRDLVSRPNPPAVIHILFTHFHWDHVQGLPFFLPLYSPRTRLILYSAHPPEELRCVLAGQMRSPYFPVLFEQVGAKIEFRQISCSEPTQFGDLEIDAFPLHHPQGSVGFRLVHPLRTAVYATDHEHGDPGSQCGLLFKSRDADVLIYDAQYTPAEYPKRVGWGHSTWLEATQVARRADVKQLVLFHHDPEREDDAVQCIEDQAREEFAETLAAYEGLVL